MKNRTLRISLILAILTLVTSCFMGSTFAKYVTSDSGFDTARVAKFGVVVDAAAMENGFVKTYGDTVASSTEEDVVAPGTKGTFGAIVVTGKPEVDVRVSYTAVLTLDKWAVDGDDYYCPIVITVFYNGNTEVFSGLNYADKDAFKTAVENHINALAVVYKNNKDLNDGATKVSDDLTISWAWAYEGATGTEENQDDAKDTMLGDKAAADNAATIKLELTCTVTQVDPDLP